MKQSIEQLHRKYNSSFVYILGNIAIIAAGVLFVLYNVARFAYGVSSNLAFLTAISLWAFVGLLAVVISRCLKNLEARVPPK